MEKRKKIRKGSEFNNGKEMKKRKKKDATHRERKKETKNRN